MTKRELRPSSDDGLMTGTCVPDVMACAIEMEDEGHARNPGCVLLMILMKRLLELHYFNA